MHEDTITVWRNEFDAVIDKGGEECLCDESIVKLALELESKIYAYESSRS